MPHFFSPAWLKKAHRFSKGVKKFIAYQRDLITPEKLEEVDRMRQAYDAALKAKDREAIEGTEAEGDKRAVDGLEKKLLKVCEGAVPNYSASPLKENVEVIIVAVIVALGIRAYYLQPFKIPTASMQPTLNGIIATRMNEGEDSPNFIKQGWNYVWNGRNYVECRIPKEWNQVQLVSYQQQSKLNFFTFTTLTFSVDGRTEQMTMYSPARQLLGELCHVPAVTMGAPEISSDDNPTAVPLGLMVGGPDGKPVRMADGKLQMRPQPVALQGGDLLAKGYVESGDQLLVDKVSYHFRRPRRDEVFVFSTREMPVPNQVRPQHYIKRLVALPGDEVRIEGTDLLVNGEVVTAPGSARVMSGKDGFHGYSENGEYPYVQRSQGGLKLQFPQPGYTALGDNSRNSQDSRYWGPVWEKNLVGPALFVYWPFANHFGFIR